MYLKKSSDCLLFDMGQLKNKYGLFFWSHDPPDKMLTGWRLVLSKFIIIPQRYVLSIMALLAIANAYTMRVCLNLAITQMVVRTNSEESLTALDETCPTPESATMYSSLNTSIYAPVKLMSSSDVKFEWSEATQGLLLSAFYYGYVLTHIPGGMFAERYGGKWVLGLGLLSTATCTFATPTVVKMWGAPGLFALRVIEGLGEGPTMPGMMAMVSKWAPANERARIGAIVFGGAQIGNIAGSIISGFIMHSGTWEDVFYVFGGGGLIWFALWTVLCYSTPNTHPYISDKEKKYLNKTVDALIHTKKKELDPVPWKAMLRSCPLWALIFAAIGHDWGYFTMVTDLPKYMTDVLKFNIKDAGILSSLPYISMWFASFLFGLICDFCIKKGWHSITFARKFYTTIAATGPGICILCASYSGCNHTLAVLWFIIAMTLMGAYYSGMKINPLDITPNFCGTTTALVNGIAAISGIIAPYLIGLLTPDSTLGQWRIAFWVCFVVLFITNVVYWIYCKAEQLWWDDVSKYGYPEGWKHGDLPTRKVDPESSSDADRRKSSVAIPEK